MIGAMQTPRPTAPFDADTYSVLVMLTLPLGLYPFYLRRYVWGTALTLLTLGGWALLAAGLCLGRALPALAGGMLLPVLFAVGLRQARQAYAVTARLGGEKQAGPPPGTPQP